jgi:hypothetical protein
MGSAKLGCPSFRNLAAILCRQNRNARSGASRQTDVGWRRWTDEKRRSVGGEYLDFLGFHHRYVHGRTPRSRHLTYLARWPSHQAMRNARERIRELTDRRRLLFQWSRSCRM